MEKTALFELADLVRGAALQEAFERTKVSTAASNQATNTDDAQSSQPSQDFDNLEEEVDELLATYEDEKAKNDALAEQIDQRLERLASTRPDKEPEAQSAQARKRKAKELEWQQLDFAIRDLQEENKQAPPLESIAVQDTRTRAEIQDIVTQYGAALETLKEELSAERESLSRELQLLSDLEIVCVGLEKRQTQLQRKKAADLTSESTLRDLSRKREKEERQLPVLLSRLVDVGTALFKGNDQQLRRLRFYFDAFLNRAWDFPLDPWVDAKELGANRRAGTGVDDSMIEFFIRANIIVAHPKDARRWRLVAFHKPTRTSI